MNVRCVGLGGNWCLGCGFLMVGIMRFMRGKNMGMIFIMIESKGEEESGGDEMDFTED